MIKNIIQSKNYQLFISAVCSSLLFMKHVGCVSLLEGPSMLPTFNIVGDVVVVDKHFYKGRPLEQGAVYVYVSPENPNRLVIKRILGLPGDVIYVDPRTSDERIRIPTGHFWAQGDNYDLSNDSRHYGPVPFGLLHGKIVWQIWPVFKRISSNMKPVE